MLNQLSIRNVAVIDKLDINLHDGVSVLTGETGAGKSIIIDSINMILGDRANKELVRYGTDTRLRDFQWQDARTLFQACAYGE